MRRQKWKEVKEHRKERGTCRILLLIFSVLFPIFSFSQAASVQPLQINMYYNRAPCFCGIRWNARQIRFTNQNSCIQTLYTCICLLYNVSERFICELFRFGFLMRILRYVPPRLIRNKNINSVDRFSTLWSGLYFLYFILFF